MKCPVALMSLVLVYFAAAMPAPVNQGTTITNPPPKSSLAPLVHSPTYNGIPNPIDRYGQIDGTDTPLKALRTKNADEPGSGQCWEVAMGHKKTFPAGRKFSAECVYVKNAHVVGRTGVEFGSHADGGPPIHGGQLWLNEELNLDCRALARVPCCIDLLVDTGCGPQWSHAEIDQTACDRMPNKGITNWGNVSCENPKRWVQTDEERTQEISSQGGALPDWGKKNLPEHGCGCWASGQQVVDGCPATGENWSGHGKRLV